VPVDPAGEITDTPTPTPAPGPAARPKSPKVLAAFKRYKIAAFIVGWGLLILCAAMVLKYAFDLPRFVAIWGPIHGALFVGYVIIAFDLAYKDRWSPLGTLWVLVAGTIPFVSFVAERQVQRKVLAGQRM
jgi:integral membrane protein